MDQVTDKKRWWFLPLMLCLLVLLPSLARALDTTTFTGYFADRKYIRIAPEANTSVVAWVPAGTTLTMTPVSDSYAETTYGDVTGFIYYGDVIRGTDGILASAATPTPAPTATQVPLPLPTATAAADGSAILGQVGTDTPVVAYVAYAATAQAAFAQPTSDAEVSAVFPAYTPFAVVAHNGEYVKIRTGVGDFSYVHASGLYELAKDIPVTEYDAYIDSPKVLYDKPLAGANVAAILTPPSDMTVTAINGDYVRASVAGRSGYILAEEIIRRETATGDTSFATVPQAAILYTSPDAQSFTSEYLPAHTLVEIDATVNGYSRIKASGLYVQNAAVSLLARMTKSPQARYGYWEQDQPLYASTDEPMLPAGVTLRANTLVEVSYELGDFYLVNQDDTLGFVPKEGLQVLSISQEITPIAAYVTREMTLLSQPFSFSTLTGQTLPANTHLWLTEESGQFYRVAVEGATGYISKASVVLLGEDVPSDGFEVYIDDNAPLLHFPSSAYGRNVATLPQNTLVKILATNGDFYYVQSVLGSGYLEKHLAMTMAQAQLSATPAGQTRYYLFLNKSTRELTIYYADDAGNRTESIYKTITVAIGKQTTPTPSGTFTLGGKERWHYFGPSYAPFAIAFTPGKYVHGPLYYSDAETSLNENRIEDFGTMATGGCIRMPYDDALWIYFHCMGDTKLEIVNGVTP